jgi:putative polyketide hydroxylase
VAELTVEQALLRLRERTDTAPEDESAPAERGSTLAERESSLAELDYYATVLGYRYRSTATVDTDAALPAALEPQRLNGQPGTRAPHIRLAGDNGTASTLDLFGDGFVVLTGARGQHWCVAAREAATELDVDVAAYRVGADVIDVENKWSSTYQVGDDGAVLVRPDGFVAWRAESGATDRHRTLVENALRLVLGRRGNQG